MATILQKIKQLQALDEMQVAVDSIKETKEGITDAIILQLSMGVRSDGSEILPSYKDVTIEIKKLKGQETRFVNLFDTGAFYRSIKTDVSGLSVVTSSEDGKADKLVKKYATQRGRLLKAGGKPKQEYIDEKLTPEFLKQMKKAIGLK